MENTKENTEKILNFLTHYNKKIHLALESQKDDVKNQERILHCLKKLQTIKINVHHLQQTKIGRTVNLCRNHDGEVGDLAQQLIEKWKTLVPVATSESENDIKAARKEPERSHHNSKKSHESSERKEKSSSSSSKHKSSSSSSKSLSSSQTTDKAHKHKSNHHTSTSSFSSHNDKEKEKSSSSSKKRRSSTEPELQSKDRETKKLKTESGETKDQKSHKSSSSSNGHDKHHSSKKDSKSKKKDRKPSKEFDVSQGIGFAEALASFDMPTSSKHQKKELADKIIPVKLSKSSTSSSSSSSKHKSSSSKSEPKSSSSNELLKPPASLTSPPKILTQKPKLEILNDIMSDLPSNVSIPEYRPMPLNSAIKDYINTNMYGSNSTSSRHNKLESMNESELLAESFSSKSNRMRVYSGNAKARSQIPKLFDLCIRALQENIDFLECTGGVPFEILKPVLEKAKPEQLATIEYYNPYLLEESDILWQPICTRKWKNKKPQEMETWREMYDRCFREEEEKLSRLTQSIRQNQEMTSSGIQKTKMAYVDSMVKPPRSIMRKQEQFGTNRKLVASPAARTQALRHIAPNLTNSGDVRLRVAAGLRDDAQQVVGRGNFGNTQRKAPLMAKILSKFKR